MNSKHILVFFVQICQFYGDHEVDPDQRDAEPQPKTKEFVSSFIRTHLKGVSTTPAIFEICMYADTVSVLHVQVQGDLISFSLSLSA